MGGYVRYLTDLPATNGYPVTVIFPRDEDMTVVRQGAFDHREDRGAGGREDLPGVRWMFTTPSFSSASYTRYYDARLALNALAPYAKGTIGLVGTYQLSHAHAAFFLEEMPDADFREASELIDSIKAFKSPEEIAQIRLTAALQDEAMQATLAALRPGMRERDVTAIAMYETQKRGAEQGIYLAASAKAGTPMPLNQRHFQNRTLNEGDQLILLIETNGPGGQYAELGRACVLGKAPEQLLAEQEVALAARNFVCDLLKPGADAAEIYAEYSDWLQSRGRPQERRLFAHGQGYDMVERPLLRQDETMRLGTSMNLAVHPSYIHGGVRSWICDNYLIDQNGELERLHQMDEAILEL
ncbi:M24 family metallopeptidase [Hoeflea sp. CAU 1731]